MNSKCYKPLRGKRNLFVVKQRNDKTKLNKGDDNRESWFEKIMNLILKGEVYRKIREEHPLAAVDSSVELRPSIEVEFLRTLI